jgi:hypothetical protein
MSEFKYQYNELQRKWLDDLKTTTANQCKEYLHIREENFEGFCCLGRACIVAKLPELADWCDFSVDYGQGGEENTPKELAAKLKLRTRGGELKQPIMNTFTHLTCLNDKAEWSFKQIAEYIEAHPDNVFSDYEDQKKEWTAKQNEAAGNDIISFTRLDSKPESGNLPKQ